MPGSDNQRAIFKNVALIEPIPLSRADMIHYSHGIHAIALSIFFVENTVDGYEAQPIRINLIFDPL
jgi:hypothetical protein